MQPVIGPLVGTGRLLIKLRKFQSGFCDAALKTNTSEEIVAIDMYILVHSCAKKKSSSLNLPQEGVMGMKCQ